MIASDQCHFWPVVKKSLVSLDGGVLRGFWLIFTGCCVRKVIVNIVVMIFQADEDEIFVCGKLFTVNFMTPEDLHREKKKLQESLFCKLRLLEIVACSYLLTSRINMKIRDNVILKIHLYLIRKDIKRVFGQT